ncbi:hypothetical protein [Sorangium sp. So ce861]|uniref:hypothetical protein n=1 Tax=Sorangium sp. So ce861 TaxID=3133323 RepID=UPI003F648203
MQSLSRSTIWSEFKDYYAAFDGVDSIARLEALSDRIAAWDDSLTTLFPGEAELAENLGALLDERAKARRRALHKPRGRRPRPDRSADLKSSIGRLVVEHRALQGLRRLGADDPWAEDTLKPAVELSIAVVETRIELLAREKPSSPLLGEARRAVASARAGLAPSP